MTQAVYHPPQIRGLQEPVLNLLLATYPLLRFLRGDRREHFRRAWMAAALSHASDIMMTDEGKLPASPRAVILALHAAVLELGDAMGITRRDFIDAFNAHAEDGPEGPDGADELMRRCIALLSVLAARRLEAAI